MKTDSSQYHYLHSCHSLLLQPAILPLFHPNSSSSSPTSLPSLYFSPNTKFLDIMLMITSAIKVLSITSQENNKFDILIAIPTADGNFIQVPASVWVKAGRIVEPEVDGDYLCVAAILDPASDELHVYTLHPLPEVVEPCPAQVTVSGLISPGQDDFFKVIDRVYRDNTESYRSITANRPGGWKTRRQVLTTGAAIQVVGELENLNSMLASNFYLMGATTKLPSTATPATARRAQVWGRRPKSTTAPTSKSPSTHSHGDDEDQLSSAPSSSNSSPPSRNRFPAIIESDPLSDDDCSAVIPERAAATPTTTTGKRRGRPPKARADLAPPPARKTTKRNTPDKVNQHVAEIADEQTCSKDEDVPVVTRRLAMRRYID
ncbi:hypothetical protein DFS34DRAFT_671928 [Phlyctochytrium arcticum]|nr:hypothetical protein DFS34DRAFT_671928 [Phlyctochytrium arcticum]